MELENNAGSKELGMKEKVDALFDTMIEANKKKMKIPRKAKVSKGQMRKGWIGVLYVDENRVLKAEKMKLDGNVIREKKDIRYHATNGKEILFWEGKHPVIIQKTWKVNPEEFNKEVEDNETYGQKYIMARMLADVIKVKKAAGFGLVGVVGLAIAGYLAYTFIFGG